MPLQFAGSDLLLTKLIAGDVEGAQSAWPTLWERADDATAWTKWLIAGRLMYARSEIALHAEEGGRGRVGVACDRHRAQNTASEVRGALADRARPRAHRARPAREALEALRAAIAIADELVNPPGRWQAQAALGEAAYRLGEDEVAGAAYEAAALLVDEFAHSLSPSARRGFLSAPAIADTLSRAGRVATPRV